MGEMAKCGETGETGGDRRTRGKRSENGGKGENPGGGGGYQNASAQPREFWFDRVRTTPIMRGVQRFGYCASVVKSAGSRTLPPHTMSSSYKLSEATKCQSRHKKDLSDMHVKLNNTCLRVAMVR